jgi:peptidyl-tRNA hydrolase, PTH1 family
MTVVLPTEIVSRLIVGLGNPGREYQGTRHNVGFDLVDLIARIYKMNVTKSSGNALIGDGMVGGDRLYLMKPQTYMNLSGEALSHFLRNKPLPSSHIMVITDDIHLPFGKIRLRMAGSDGGHNGLKSIASHLRTRDYPRLRIGVGSPGDPAHQVDYVLGKFSRSEQKQMEETLETAAAAVSVWMAEGGEAAMNKFNS